MDGTTGKFTVPTAGIYRLTFAGASAAAHYDSTYIQVRKNGEQMFEIWDSNAAKDGDGNNVASTWLWDLKKGDTVDLHSETYLKADSEWHLIFTGELIHVAN